MCQRIESSSSRVITVTVCQKCDIQDGLADITCDRTAYRIPHIHAKLQFLSKFCRNARNLLQSSSALLNIGILELKNFVRRRYEQHQSCLRSFKSNVVIPSVIAVRPCVNSTDFDGPIWEIAVCIFITFVSNSHICMYIANQI